MISLYKELTENVCKYFKICKYGASWSLVLLSFGIFVEWSLPYLSLGWFVGISIFKFTLWKHANFRNVGEIIETDVGRWRKINTFFPFWIVLTTSIVYLFLYKRKNSFVPNKYEKKRQQKNPFRHLTAQRIN